MRQTGSHDFFEARIADLCRHAETRYECAFGEFLSPGDTAKAKLALMHISHDAIPVFFGGYEGSERTRLVILPAFMEQENALDGANLRRCYPEVAEAAVCAVRVRGSGFRKLAHKDYLGSVLALGLERDVVGDIVVEDDFSAIVFCDPGISSYILQSLTRIGSDSVRTELMEISSDFKVERQFEEVRDTVASPRLDCIVAALAGLSREKAQLVIRAEEVDVDYVKEPRVDRQIGEGSIITVRHKGKFILRSIGEQTKKGRYRLVADKYI